MHNKIQKVLIAAALLLAPLAVSAQSGSNSMNTFSPYTFYGIGDLQPQGTAETRAMGGVGVAYWNPTSINVLNPASYASVGRNSFLFNVGMSGKQSYLKSSSSKTSHNAFNISDIAIQFPLARGVGFTLSVLPYSSVGYEVTRFEDDNDILTEIGVVKYNYRGEGGINSYKAGMGVQLFSGISLGADFIYYLGTIDRYYTQEIIAVMSNDTYRNASIREREEVSKASFAVGLHYDAIREERRMLTFGLTYQPQVKLKNKSARETVVGTTPDSIVNATARRHITVPGKIAAGVYYRTQGFGAGFDFSMQDWSGAFDLPAGDNKSLRAVNSYNLGVQYTPDRLDIRSVFNRWTYRAGVRYNDLYLKSNGRSMTEIALTFGVGIPVKLGSFSALNLGVEAGRAGTTSGGQIRENYLKISAGFSLFGDDDWFVKRRFF